MELWRDIEGYPGYQVSSMGNVKNIKSNKLLAQSINHKGYRRVHLNTGDGQKMVFVHRLVALAFIPNPQGLPQVNHKNENKEDNCVENLEWVKVVDNLNYGERNRKASESLTNHPKLSKQITQFTLDGKLVASYPSMSEASRQTGVAFQNISKVCRGERKQAGGFFWEYYKKPIDNQD